MAGKKTPLPPIQPAFFDSIRADLIKPCMGMFYSLIILMYIIEILGSFFLSVQYVSIYTLFSITY